jgi:hypothetical protein
MLLEKGFTSIEIIDYYKIFSPMVKCHSIRVLMKNVNQYNFKLEKTNVKITLLHGELEEKIYMRNPQDFVEDKDVEVIPSSSIGIQPLLVAFFSIH